MKDARAATDELESATRGASTVILGATAYEGRDGRSVKQAPRRQLGG